MRGRVTVQIAVRLADEELERLDDAIARGAYPNRAAAVRAGLHRLLADEREARIAEAYRLGYATSPVEREIGEAGLALGAGLFAEPGSGDPAA
jgi:Arc/MetJ-type ribon-helix-helix transcriptional regulator